MVTQGQTKELFPTKREVRKNKMSPTPYWNFWKVILAGWIIRYPKQFFNIFLLIAAIVAVRLLN
jgi:hypothetical protein